MGAVVRRWLRAFESLFGVGLDAAMSRRAVMSFGDDQRYDSFIDERQWTTKLRYEF